ncbi:hypothetical protein EZV73_25295 [Acidaminobacter sp. JC074]|uniref:oligosaccharide flippase family protein n=1 Tax=Acidaminobacter sp. JC074 TaxID=2530199 RepID=UPI001F11403E|nr:polysaccharide biosynthesis C-terminal domain-containing protein [Acidaminobacter sp. JC074]MCH4890921.1 hypothetical protein [Acidaminobacter sp. JC074]
MKKSILSGAIFLTLISIISKFIGIFFRIPMTKIIGAVGNGIFTFPIQFFAPIIAMIAAPSVVIARMVSETDSDVYRTKILKVSRSFMVQYGLIVTLILIVMGPILTQTVWPKEVIYAYMALLPAPIFLALTTTYKGYHQGLQEMTPLAIQQFADGIGRLILGLGLTLILIQFSIPLGAAGATFGTTAGAMTGFICLYIHHKRTHKILNVTISQNNKKDIRSELFRASLPITISALGANMMGFIDGLLVQSRLSGIGFTSADILTYNGILSSINTITSIPLAIAIAISLNALPNIVAAKNYGKAYMATRMRSAMIMIVSIAIPSGLGLFIVGRDLFHLFYSTLPTDHYLMNIASISVIFMMINMGLTAILQAYKLEKTTVRNMYLGVLLKFVATFVLLGLPSLNIHGAALGTCLAYGIVVVLNLLSCIKAGFKVDIKYMVMVPMVSSLIMAAIVYVIVSSISGIIGTFIGILSGGFIYGILMLAFKVVALKDIPFIKRWF